jgi:hypothetical protein
LYRSLCGKRNQNNSKFHEIYLKLRVNKED